MNYIATYFIALPVFFIIDLLWLGVIAKPIYQKFLGHMLLESPRWGFAIAFYLLFILGLVIFAIQPAIVSGSAQKALFLGAMFGFFSYMTYEFTNYSLIKGWPIGIVPIDIVWGIFLSGAVSVCTFYLHQVFIG
ncbi:DUF2177 family protein [Candidatus Nomurabacteria bacterium]|nr:DUF2177 family protein [Candidatus Nomurabacteria bacterium]USN95111.1 MAG: DUF2177 family protein [Candidatus Nomurabacteria bacterium]